MFTKLKKILFIILISVFLTLTPLRSNAFPGDQLEQFRKYTRAIEFDYVDWTIDALFQKLAFTAFNPVHYLPDKTLNELTRQQITDISKSNWLDYQIETIYADPNIDDPTELAKEYQLEWVQLQKKKTQTAPFVENIMQNQISLTLHQNQLTLGGQVIPPVMFHSTPLPLALIISPRDIIRQDADLSLLADLGSEDILELEAALEEEFNISALVVPVGGVGIYPSMVKETSNLVWLCEVISHEWTHNYLTLHPLGVRYFQSPQLRTINETTANLTGKEIGSAVLEIYYPEFVPQSAPPQTETESVPKENSEPVFDYRAEMHITRVEADRLLAESKIGEAEAYMEARRVFFWENGYHIRKLNQAYFAFYGAYADVPGGAAGVDPVGPAVVALRDKHETLASFLKEIAQIKSYEELQIILAEKETSQR